MSALLHKEVIIWGDMIVVHFSVFFWESPTICFHKIEFFVESHPFLNIAQFEVYMGENYNGLSL